MKLMNNCDGSQSYEFKNPSNSNGLPYCKKPQSTRVIRMMAFSTTTEKKRFRQIQRWNIVKDKPRCRYKIDQDLMAGYLFQTIEKLPVLKPHFCSKTYKNGWVYKGRYILGDDRIFHKTNICCTYIYGSGLSSKKGQIPNLSLAL